MTTGTFWPGTRIPFVRFWRALNVLGTIVLLCFSQVGVSPGEVVGRPELEAKHVGLTPGQLEVLSESVLAAPSLRLALAGRRHRLLSFEMVDEYSEAPLVPERFRAVIFDYSSNRSMIAEGSIDSLDDLGVRYSEEQPLPSAQEFEAAVELVRDNPLLGPHLVRGTLRPYRPMPPIIIDPLARVPVNRTLAVGLRPMATGPRHEIVGVDMIAGTVLRYVDGAPPNSEASETTCGPVASLASSPQRGTAGQTEVSVKVGTEELWHFFVVRPAASTGTNGSGVELRYVDFRGRRVLGRAHVPIVNVNYLEGGCGPYRDWLFEEGDFTANGIDATSGHRRCSEVPVTIHDAAVDDGLFNGVAYYMNGSQLVLVSEMQAGWYRYVQEWRFEPDGTIKPRFFFAATGNSCTCMSHVHHAYWRFDFDVDGAGNDILSQYDASGPNEGSWQVLDREGVGFRDSTRVRHWSARDASTNAGYMIMPSHDDGVADTFAVADFWALKNHHDEIDDGVPFTTLANAVPAGLNRFLDDESVREQDVVVWYGIHVGHRVGDVQNYVGGPDLVPIDR